MAVHMLAFLRSISSALILIVILAWEPTHVFGGKGNGKSHHTAPMSHSAAQAAIAPSTPSDVGENPSPQIGEQRQSSYPGFMVEELASASADGAYTFQIPITIESASTKLLPYLALAYSSSMHEGQAGLGWRIADISSIQRCPATIEPDGNIAPIRFDTSDHFCMDSDRLIAVAGAYGENGTEYRLEVDDNRRIKSLGDNQKFGPGSFIVWDRNGVVRTYGDSPNSRLSMSSSGVIREWSISSVVDKNGNSIRFKYSNDNATGKLSLEDIIAGQIRDGVQLDRHHVRLIYEPSDDARAQYRYGAPSVSNRRLKELVILQDQVQQSSFKFAYLPSLATGLPILASVQMCGSDGICMLAYKIEWKIPSMTGDRFQTEKSAAGLPGLGLSQWLLDINGDGLPDYVTKSAENKISWNINSGAGWGQTQSQDGLHGLGAARWFVDINGDGLPDYIAKNNDGVLHWNLNTGSGWGASQSQAGLHGLGAVQWFVDINGDGLPDYVAKNNDGVLHWNLNRGTGYDSAAAFGPSHSQPGLHGLGVVQWFVDINGDGLPDYVAKNNDDVLHWNLNRGTGYDSAAAFGPSQSQARVHGLGAVRWFVDINGDGLLDYVAKNSDDVLHWNLNTGSGWGASQSQGGLHGLGLAQWMVDLNGDGLPDYLAKNADGNMHWNLNTGTGYASAKPWGASQSQAGTHGLGTVRWMEDINGDGVVDYIAKNDDGNIIWNLAISGTMPLLTKITTPMGGTIDITYGKTVGKLSPTERVTYPRQVVTFPMTTLSNIETRVHVGAPALRHSFEYHNPTADLLRREWEGFGKAISTDHYRGVVTTTTYKQKFPFTGKVSLQSKKVKNGSEIARTEFDWVSKHSSNIYTVHLDQSRKYSSDLNGVGLGNSSTKYDYDNYGNTKRILEQFSDGYSRDRQTSFFVDTENWLLNLPIETAIVVKSFTEGSSARRSKYRYDSKGNLIRSEEDAGDFGAVVHEFEYSKTGKVTKELVADIPRKTTRQTVFEYDKYDRLERTTNVLGHSITVSYVENRDLPSRLTDSNGLVARLEYDGLGRLIKRTDPGGGYSKFAYEILQGSGEFTVSQIRNGGVPEFETFDSARHLIKRRIPLGDGLMAGELFKYDPAGRLSAYSRRYLLNEPPLMTSLTRDSLDRVLKINYPNGATILHSYDGLRTTTIDPKGRVTTRKLNIRGTLASQQQNGQPEVSYGYDLWDRLAKVRGPLQFDLSIYRDNLGRVLSHADQHSGVKHFVWNAFGDLIEERAADGASVRYEYDDIGRVIAQEMGGKITRWSYDSGPYAIGKISGITRSDGLTETFQYDNRGRLKLRTRVFDGVQHELLAAYDEFGRVSSLKYPLSEIVLDYKYGQDGEPIKVEHHDKGTIWEANEFDASGAVLREQVGGNVNLKITLDPTDGLPVKVQAERPGDDALISLEYYHDIVGNLVRRIDRVQRNESFYEYDEFDRLIEWEDTSSTDHFTRYHYDLAGNMLTSSNRFSASYGDGMLGPHALSEITLMNDEARPRKGQAIEYDKRGSITYYGKRRIAYGLHGLPTNIEMEIGERTALSQVNQYDFNNDRLRSKTVTSKSCWMSLRTCSIEEERLYFGRLVETQSTPRECIIKSNVYARGKLKAVIETASAQDCKLVLKYGTPSQSETMRWLVLAEPMGRINQYLASDGSKVIKMDYTPYGLTKGSSLSGSESRITARSFGGLYFDKDTGLFYSNARLYEPRLGRFLSSDKNDELQAGSQYLNRYSYALNNPLRYGDSTGFVPGEYSVSSPSERAGREKFFNEKKEWADRGIERSRGEREIREGRYNGRERMESLPKLELPKIGDSYSRSSERSYSVLPRPPVAPVGESIDRNVASQLVGSGNGFDVDFAIWVAMVAPGSFWDYKTQGSFYEEAGNFNYGATGAALGLPESVLLRAAGAVQECCGAYKPEFGHAWDSTGSFGDDPRDQRDIRLGIEYTRHRDLIRFLDGEW